jgi:Tol biopolymer transport system component
MMDTTGANLQMLTTQGVDASFGLPFSWSPNSTNIAYIVYRSNDWGYQNGTLWTLDLNTGEKKELTFNIKP